jgi:hypothetical protein
MKNDNVKCKKFNLHNLPILDQIDGKNTNGQNVVKTIFFRFDF